MLSNTIKHIRRSLIEIYSEVNLNGMHFIILSYIPI